MEMGFCAEAMWTILGLSSLLFLIHYIENVNCIRGKVKEGEREMLFGTVTGCVNRQRGREHLLPLQL